MIDKSNSQACAYFRNRGKAAQSLLLSPVLIAQFEQVSGGSGASTKDSTQIQAKKAIGLEYDIMNLPRSLLTSRLYAAKCDLSLISNKIKEILLELAKGAGGTLSYSPSLALKQRLLETALQHFQSGKQRLRENLRRGLDTVALVQAYETRLAVLKDNVIETGYLLANQPAFSVAQIEGLPLLVQGMYDAITRREKASGRLRALTGVTVNLRAGAVQSDSPSVPNLDDLQGLADLAGLGGSLGGQAENDDNKWGKYVGVQVKLNLGTAFALRYENKAANLAASAEMEQVSSPVDQIIRLVVRLRQKVIMAERKISSWSRQLATMRRDYRLLRGVRNAKYLSYQLRSDINIQMAEIERKVLRHHVGQLRQIIAILERSDGTGTLVIAEQNEETAPAGSTMVSGLLDGLRMPDMPDMTGSINAIGNTLGSIGNKINDIGNIGVPARGKTTRRRARRAPQTGLSLLGGLKKSLF